MHEKIDIENVTTFHSSTNSFFLKSGKIYIIRWPSLRKMIIYLFPRVMRADFKDFDPGNDFQCIIYACICLSESLWCGKLAFHRKQEKDNFFFI